MRLISFGAIVLLLFAIKVSPAQSSDYFHEKISAVAGRFQSLNIPNLEKIQLPQAQPDGSYIFVYIWLPRTHRPTQASFEANIGDYFDILGAGGQPFHGWCYLEKPESAVSKTLETEVGVMRIRALGYYGRRPRHRCRGLPGAAGKLGQTQIVKDPQSGEASMIRSGYPTRFPLIKDAAE